MMDDFLQTALSIKENNAEYVMLTELSEKHSREVFMLKFDDMDSIRQMANDIDQYIHQNYRTFNLMEFLLLKSKVTHSCIRDKSGKSYNEFDLANLALEKSKENCYVLLNLNDDSFLFFNGNFDEKYKKKFISKKKEREKNNKKFDIEELDKAFCMYQTDRGLRDAKCFLSNGRVNTSITEQDLRNHLYSFLTNNVKGHITFEENTYTKNDEESVDLAVVNRDGFLSIIEVKFFVMDKLFSSSGKNGYGVYRFRDGYEQLDKYCENLAADSRDVHSTFLYMFYAHEDDIVKIKEKAREYFKRLSVSSLFNKSFKATVFDNMMNTLNISEMIDMVC
ncbi:hypothetical protein HB803_13850 [Listeria welshimeri]|nr:hypothetical protein [Listeria welshimeri]